MNTYIKNLIRVNKDANEAIEALEKALPTVEIEDDKDKANFGNLCLILKSYRIINEASEAMLFNEDVLSDGEGNFYEKIKEDDGNKKEDNGKGQNEE